MTIMVPDRPYEGVTKSEADLFRQIQQAPGTDSFYCLHSIGIAHHSYKAYSEGDFLVVCPMGAFYLEAKGGRIKRENGIWTIGTPEKQYTTHEGPFKQAQSAMQALRAELEKSLPAPLARHIMFGWGVMFPHVVFTERDPEWDLNVVYDARDQGRIKDYLVRLARHTARREATAGRTYSGELSRDEIRTIVECLRHDFDLVPSLRYLVAESDRELVALSPQQYKVLDYALSPGNPRCLCPGGAGTGKTLVALEAAQRLARSGKRVLFLCYNRLLEEFLSSQIKRLKGSVVVHSVHRWMRTLIERAGLLDRLEGDGEAPRDEAFFTETYPVVFEEAIVRLLDEDDAFHLYDVLVVDEAQDIFSGPMLDAIELSLRGGISEGQWLLFFDPGLQAGLYNRFDGAVLSRLRAAHPAELPLTENFRNPRLIVEEMCVLTGAPLPPCKRELVSRVEYLTYSNEASQGKQLRALLVRLIKDGVDPERITVLSGCKLEDACVKRHPPDIGKPVHHLGSGHATVEPERAIQACTVSGYKGLENDVVVITDITLDPDNSAWQRSVAYVAMTRPRVKLFALVPDTFVARRFHERKADQV